MGYLDRNEFQKYLGGKISSFRQTVACGVEEKGRVELTSQATDLRSTVDGGANNQEEIRSGSQFKGDELSSGNGELVGHPVMCSKQRNTMVDSLQIWSST